MIPGLISKHCLLDRLLHHGHHRFLSSVEVFDDVSKQWYPLPPLLHPRAGLALTGHRGRLYAVGGWRDHQYVGEVESWDPLTNTWSALPPLLHTRAKHGLVSVKEGGEEALLAIAGVSGFRQKDNLDSIERYHLVLI